MLPERGRDLAKRIAGALACAAVASLCLHCGGKDGNTSPGTTTPSPNLPPGTTPTPIPIPAAPQTFVGAADIGWCGNSAPEQTAKLLDGIGGTIFAAGDLAYFSGTAQEFHDCYDSNWGRHRARTRPVPGNHERVTNVTPYFNYFGFQAGTTTLGYYSYELGDWHIVALDSWPSAVATGEAQWLQDDLASSSAKCTLAYWHYPLFSSGMNQADGAGMRDIWRILYNNNADVIVNGHEHFYERFAPQDPDGRPDSRAGIRQFIAGTGGANLYDFVTVRANSEVRIKANGVLKFTLSSGTYQWEFIPIPGSTGGADSGSGTCH
jgi:hypothetical protein